MAQDGSTFHPHRKQMLPNYPKEPNILPYRRQNHSTPSVFNNHDPDSYHDNPSYSPQHESDTPFESFNLYTSNKTIAQPQANLHSPSIYQNLSPSTPLNDNLHETVNSTESGFEMIGSSLAELSFVSRHNFA